MARTLNSRRRLLVGAAGEFEELGETLEKAEVAKFGTDGFEKMAKRVEQLEKRIGTDDLAQATPKD